MDYVYFDTTGEIVAWCSMPEGEAPTAIPNTTLLEGFGKETSHYVQGGVLVPYTSEEVQRKAAKPAYSATWSNTSKTWVDQRSLSDLKAEKLLEINRARAQANQTSFQYLGKTVACDRLSRSDIDAVNGEMALTNAFPANWPGGWKCVDNTYVSIPDRATWTAFYQAMTAQGTANFVHAQTLKAQVTAATTISAVEAINW